jgi:hypothetical protein
MLRRCFPLLSDIALILAATESAASGKKIPAPDWQLTDVDGKPVKLSDFRRNCSYICLPDESYGKIEVPRSRVVPAQV